MKSGKVAYSMMWAIRWWIMLCCQITPYPALSTQSEEISDSSCELKGKSYFVIRLISALYQSVE